MEQKDCVYGIVSEAALFAFSAAFTKGK